MTFSLNPAQRQRVERELWLLPIYIWVVFAWSMYAIDISPAGRLDRAGHIKGHDFAGFYVMGQLVNDGVTYGLYSFQEHASRLDRLVPEYEHRFIPVNVPQLALLFAPLARRPYLIALSFWLVFSVVAYFACCYSIWLSVPSIRNIGWRAIVVAAGFPPFYSLISYGHITALPLICCTAAWFAFRGGHDFLGGFLLGSIFVKPQLGVALPVVFLFARQWHIIAGAAAAVLLQVGIAFVAFGANTLWTYARVVAGLGDITEYLEPSLYQMHSLRSFFSILLPWQAVALACYFGASVLILWRAAMFWISEAPVDLRYSVLLISMVLVDPHVNVYDLVVLAPALIIAASVTFRAWKSGKLLLPMLYAFYFLPAAPALAQAMRIQFSVPVLAAIMWSLTRRQTATPSQAPA